MEAGEQASSHSECALIRDLETSSVAAVVENKTLSAHACTARVTVVISVCLSPLILALQAPNWLMSYTNGSSATSTRKYFKN